MTRTMFTRSREVLSECGPQVADYLAAKYGGHFIVLGARGESWGLPADRFWAKRSDGDNNDTGNNDVFAVYGSYSDGVCAFTDAYYSVLIKPAYEQFVHTLTENVLSPCTVSLTLNRESPNPNGLTADVPLTDIHRYIRADGPSFCAQVTLTVPVSALRGKDGNNSDNGHNHYEKSVEALLKIADGFAKTRLMAWLKLYVITDDVTLPPIIAYTGKDYRARLLTPQGFRSSLPPHISITPPPAAITPPPAAITPPPAAITPPPTTITSPPTAITPSPTPPTTITPPPTTDSPPLTPDTTTQPLLAEDTTEQTEHTTPSQAPYRLLQDHQLERLCALVYLDGLLLQQDSGPLGEIMDYLLAYGLEECKVNGRLPCEMTEAEWLRLLRDVRLDDDLCALRIIRAEDVTEASPAGDVLPGHRAVGFGDGRGTAYAIFRGTCGDDEWYDNALGMVHEDTTQQRAAANFVAALAAMTGIERIVTAGHSKGGNKAQYAAMISPEGQVCYCFSLDGQGFSPAFMAKYQADVEKRRPLIHPTAERRDFVNCLGIYLSDATLFRSGRRGTARPDAPHGDPLPFFHCPDALRDTTGEPGPIADDAPIPGVLNQLVTYFLTAPRYETQREETALDLISLLMENKRASTEETAEALVNIITVFMDLLCADKTFQAKVESVLFNETDVLLASLALLTQRPESTAETDRVVGKPGGLPALVAERLALRIIKDKKVRADLIGSIKFLVPLLKKMRGSQDQAGKIESVFSTLLVQLTSI